MERPLIHKIFTDYRYWLALVAVPLIVLYVVLSVITGDPAWGGIVVGSFAIVLGLIRDRFQRSRSR